MTIARFALIRVSLQVSGVRGDDGVDVCFLTKSSGFGGASEGGGGAGLLLRWWSLSPHRLACVEDPRSSPRNANSTHRALHFSSVM